MQAARAAPDEDVFGAMCGMGSQLAVNAGNVMALMDGSAGNGSSSSSAQSSNAFCASFSGGIQVLFMSS